MIKFDVFVSFRDTDTRRTFVSHLLLSLTEKSSRTFKSEEEIPENQPASAQVLWAIKESKIAIVVISKNYSASVSCVDELAMIMECKEKQSLTVIPVLYEVDPSEVLRQVDDLEGHSHGNNKEKVKRWRDALVKSIKIYRDISAQWEDADSYSYIIDEILGVVTMMREMSGAPWTGVRMPTLNKLWLVPIEFVTKGIGLVTAALGLSAGRFVDKEKPSSVKSRPTRSSLYVRKDQYVSSLVGIDRQIKDVDKLMIDLDSNHGVGEIGICGVRGVGKTTLARCIYEQISPQFQDHYYFVNDGSNDSLGLDPTCLLDEITRAALIRVSKSEWNTESEWNSESESFYEVVKAELGHRKVLLIVDDVDSMQIRYIRQYSRWFGPGSRLIFISQNDYSFSYREVKCLYEVESLRYDEALQLFSQFAFKQEDVPRDYYQLSVRAVLITGRIPLALKVFGSYLRGKTINEWESELCRLEASQENCVAKVSSYIGNEFS